MIKETVVIYYGKVVVLCKDIKDKRICKTVLNRCQILLELDENHGSGLTHSQIAHTYAVCPATITNTVQSSIRNGIADIIKYNINSNYKKGGKILMSVEKVAYESLKVKEIFRCSLMELISQKQFQKISVTDIVENTELSRQSFYRYFSDKYDLINWSLKKLLDQLYEERKKSGEPPQVGLLKLLYMIKSQQNFFFQAFQMNGQNALNEFFCHYIVKSGSMEYRQALSDETELKKLDFSYRFASYGIVCSIAEWTLSGMKETPEELTEQIFDNLPEKMTHMLVFLRET